jgi:1-acyl-sn-glycerol-3-phosphate acyltransferase
MPNLEAARSSARAFSMGVLTMSMLAGVNVHQRLVAPDAQRAVFQRWMHHWASALIHLFGVRPHWAGIDVPTTQTARLVVSNHRSPLDILLLLHRFGGVVLSRADLAEWPLIGPAAQRAETIFVDRKSAVSGMIAIRALRDRLINHHTVIVFPEGTTPVGDEVLPFQPGAFAAAHGLPVEIVPVGIAYPPGSEFVEDTFGEHMARMARRKRTAVSCVIGSPRPMPASRKGVAESLREEVQALVHQARAQLDQSAARA